MSYSYIGVYFAVTSAATALSTPLFGILIENVKMYSTCMRLLGILTVVASCTLLIQFFAYDPHPASTSQNFQIMAKVLFAVSNSPDVATMRLYYLVGCGVFYSAVLEPLIRLVMQR